MSKKIFVVEDDELTVKQAVTYLEEMGYQLAGTAGSAEAALEQIRLTRPDLVLMDIRLEGAMDGIELAKRLQADGEIAVIYLTAYAEDDLVARARLAEPFGYLLKPFTRQELKACIMKPLVDEGQQGVVNSLSRSAVFGQRISKKTQWISVSLTYGRMLPPSQPLQLQCRSMAYNKIGRALFGRCAQQGFGAVYFLPEQV